jgi:hypothetical protein
MPRSLRPDCIAQAQRLKTETADPAAGKQAAEIEATLKRLICLAERLMQMARGPKALPPPGSKLGSAPTGSSASSWTTSSA